MDFPRRMRANMRAHALIFWTLLGSSAACDAGGATTTTPASAPRTQTSSAVSDERAHASTSTQGTSLQGSSRSSASSVPHEPTFVLLLHGLGGSGRNLIRHFGIDALSKQLGFEFEAPDGTVDGQGRRFWNAGESCCDFDKLGPDHVRSLGATVARERTRGKRVFVVGYSNGGFMAHRLACEVDGIAGILSVAGPSPLDVSTCKHSAARVLHVHGDADEIERFG